MGYSPQSTPIPTTKIPGDWQGLKENGNIDLDNRPHVVNPDGSVSTVLSTSFGTDKGEVLVPKIKFGLNRPMTDPEALAEYKRTGKHLGIFDTPDNADKYAEALHEQQASKIKGPMDDKIIDVPGVGNVAFPGGMADDAIAEVLKGHIAKQNQAIDAMQTKQSGSLLHETGEFGKQLGGNVLGVLGVTPPVSIYNALKAFHDAPDVDSGIKAMIKSTPVSQAYQGFMDETQKASDLFNKPDTGSHVQGIGHVLAAALPFVGHMAAEGADEVSSGQPGKGLANIITALAPSAMATPEGQEVISKAAPAVGEAAAKGVRGTGIVMQAGNRLAPVAGGVAGYLAGGWPGGIVGREIGSALRPGIKSAGASLSKFGLEEPVPQGLERFGEGVKAKQLPIRPSAKAEPTPSTPAPPLRWNPEPEEAPATPSTKAPPLRWNPQPVEETVPKTAKAVKLPVRWNTPTGKPTGIPLSELGKTESNIIVPGEGGAVPVNQVNLAGETIKRSGKMGVMQTWSTEKLLEAERVAKDMGTTDNEATQILNLRGIRRPGQPRSYSDMPKGY